MWYYEGYPLNEEMRNKLVEEGVIGFVYIITEFSTKKKYVGKKLWITKKKLPPLKGQKRKRTKIVETDWRTYYGSSENVKAIIEEKGTEEFHREILHFCYGKAEMSYLEAKEQFDREVLLRDDYYNGIINLRCGRGGLDRLKNEMKMENNVE